MNFHINGLVIKAIYGSIPPNFFNTRPKPFCNTANILRAEPSLCCFVRFHWTDKLAHVHAYLNVYGLFETTFNAVSSDRVYAEQIILED